nr:uncharacterized protein LOC108019297 [Drosophila suzukii]
MSSSESQSQTSAEGSAQDVRILCLQNLIEKNIEIEQQIESKTFDQSITAIEEIIRTANDINKGHEDPRTNSTELVLDTELLTRNHEVVGKAIQYNTIFTDRMVITAINEFVFKEQEEDWDAVCALAVQFGRPLFSNDSMLPFIDVAPKKVIPKQRAQRKQKSQVEEKRPTKSDKLDRNDKGAASVTYMLKQIRQIYREGGHQPIPYFKLNCNPNNFMDKRKDKRYSSAPFNISLLFEFVVKLWQSQRTSSLQIIGQAIPRFKTSLPYFNSGSSFTSSSETLETYYDSTDDYLYFTMQPPVNTVPTIKT